MCGTTWKPVRQVQWPQRPLNVNIFPRCPPSSAAAAAGNRGKHSHYSWFIRLCLDVPDNKASLHTLIVEERKHISITGAFSSGSEKLHSVAYNVYNCIRRLVPPLARENPIRNTVSMHNCADILRKIGFEAKHGMGWGFNSCAYDCHSECLSVSVCVKTDWIEHLISSEPSDALYCSLLCKVQFSCCHYVLCGPGYSHMEHLFTPIGVPRATLASLALH